MSEEKKNFSLSYLIKGEGKKDWYKALGNGWRIGVILLFAILVFAGGYSIWRFFFPKPLGNVSKQTMVALPFSHIDKVEQKSEQTVIQPARRFHLGTALGTGNRSDALNNSKTEFSAYAFGWVDF